MLAKLFKLAILIVCILIAVVFTLYNSEDLVKVDLYYAQVNWPLTYIVLVAMVLGFFIGLLAVSVFIIKTRNENRKLRRAVRLLDKEINALKKAPLNDA